MARHFSREGGPHGPMRPRTPTPPKITRPRAAGVLLRPRLFRLLDRGRGRRVVWIAAPPGAGKTTLVTSYVEARRLPAALWYQLDEGDGDVATFFAYLSLAAAKAAPRRPPLPLLTPEYLAGLSTFALRYFEALFARLARPFALVLDNYQDVPAASPFHEVIAEGLAQLPPGGRAIVVSRGEPPPAFARLQAAGEIQRLGWAELQLRLEESRRIARSRRRAVTPQVLGRLHEASQGWAAGLVLLLEGLGARDAIAPAPSDLPLDTVFDYFSWEVLGRLDSGTQIALMASALLGRPTARMAERLTGSPAAGRVLADLARRSYFVTRQEAREPVYQLHPLFRRFLLSRLEATHPAARLRELRRTAAGLLAADQMEEAVALFREAADWDGFAGLIRESAPALLAQGRHATLEGWLSAIPADVTAREPWLEYWLGACQLSSRPADSRLHFERAFERFVERDDRAGTLRAWAGAVEAIVLEWADFRPLDRWVGWLDAALRDGLTFPSQEVEARVISSMFVARFFRNPVYPGVREWEARAAALFRRTTPGADPRLQLGSWLAIHHMWLGELSEAAAIAARLREEARVPAASPFTRLISIFVDAYYSWYTGSPEACLRTATEGLALGRATGVHVFDAHLAMQGAWGALATGDPRAAGPLIDLVAPRPGSSLQRDIARYHYLLAWAAFVRGDTGLAVRHVETCVRSALDFGVPYVLALCHHAAAQVLYAHGKRQEAEPHLAEARRIATEMGSHLLAYICLLVDAEHVLDRGDEGAVLEPLRGALAVGRAQGFLNHPWWRADAMARLCALALEHGIEVDYVRDLVRRRGLVPEAPPVHLEAWPWAVEVVTLGRFEVRLDDRPLRFTGKAQRRPLDLLRALIAFGGQEVSEARLAEALWPDAEGDAAQRALATTLHRLRRLLGDDSAVVRQEGRLGLDPRRCWVDTWAFERLLAQADAARQRGLADQAALAESLRRTEQALALYRGPFLADAPAADWAVSSRERLQARLLRHLAGLSRHWEQAGRWVEVASCCEKALDLDACAEEFARRLMRAYQRLGRPAEALAVYQRCRRALAAALGVGPSAETEAAHDALRTAGRAVPRAAS